MKKFLNQTTPKINESLYSFLFRTAIVNHFDHLGTILKDIGPIPYTISCNYLDEGKSWYQPIMKIIQMTNINAYPLTLNQYDYLFFQNVELGKQQERFIYYRSSSKYCPECLKEHMFHRLYWDISIVTICLKHQKHLMEICPACKTKTRISRLMQDTCICGHKFSNYRNTDIIPHDVEIHAQNCIQSMILGNESSIVIANVHLFTKEKYFKFFILYSHIVDNLMIEGLFPISYGQNSFNFGMKNKEKRNVLSFSILATYIHLIIVDPQQNLIQLLDRLNDESQVNKTLRKAKMKHFHKIINVKAGEPFEEIYKQSLIKAVNVYTNRKAINIPVVDKHYLTFDEVINHYQVPLRHLKFLCNKGDIMMVAEKGVRLIEKASVEKYVQALSNSLNKHQAGKLMGLNPERVIDLAIAKRLKAFHGPKIDGNYFWSFQKQDVLQTLIWICSKCNPVNHVKKGYISFNKANFAVRHLEINTIALIDLVASGKLSSIILKKELSIKGIYIHEKDIIDFCQLEKDKRIERWGYTLLETSHILNIDVRKLKKEVEEGKIKINHEKVNQNGTTSYYIEKEFVNKMLRS